MNVTKGLLLAALVVGLPSTAPSQSSLQGNPACDSTSVTFDALDSFFGEIWQSDGRILDGPDDVMPPGSRIVLAANDDTGTWSLLVSYPQAGITCLIASGDNWQVDGGDA